uniref:Cytochrome c oxidase subunit 7A1, mitochondrial n=1 Tax=Astyanax mexicanus TaxID=7994 RepID=A0A8B9RA06_ASTMX
MRHLLSLQRVATRAFNTTARQMKNNVPEKQKLFQEDNGLPIHIKGGTTDVLLYRLTMTLTIAGKILNTMCINIVSVMCCPVEHCHVNLFSLALLTGTGLSLYWLLVAAMPKGKSD